MSKQTAVEWLVEQITNKVGYYSEEVQQEIYQQAKTIEREQIVEAFQTEWSQHNYSGEQYYANTYGKEAGHEA